MKKQLLADSAAKLYIEKFMTLENIAQKLNVNERTLRRWKAAAWCTISSNTPCAARAHALPS